MILTPSPRFPVSDGRPYNVTPDGIHYHPDTAPELVAVLERLRKSRARVRLFYGNPKTGRAWDEEHDVTGLIGNSTGDCKVPLIVHTRSFGGPHLLDHCIVAVMTSPGSFAWKAKHFTTGQWTVSTERRFLRVKGYEAASLRDGELIGRHRTTRGAWRYVAFMSGRRMAA